MICYSIRYYLYRSNPILLRTLLMPQTASVGDLLSAFCLGMGIPRVPGEIRNEYDTLLDEDQLLSEISLQPGFEGEAVIYPDQKNKDYFSLTFRFECTGRIENGADTPRILEGSGQHLPHRVFQISTVNQILSNLRRSESTEFPGLGLFFARTQAFNLQKTQRLLDTLFKPESVVLLHTELSYPLQTILENHSLPDLHRICEFHHIYFTMQLRKAQVISLIIQKLRLQSASRIFDEMDYMEYIRFKTLVTTGKTDCKDNYALIKDFPVLEINGGISLTRKAGVQILAPVLQYYDEWYDKEEEKQFLLKKKFTSVLMCCCYFYGVVTKPSFSAAYRSLFGSENPPEELFEEVRSNPHAYLRNTPYSFAEDLPDSAWIVYDSSQIPSKERTFYFSVLSEESCERYLPTLEDLARYGQKTPTDSFYYKPLKDLLEKMFYSQDDQDEYYQYILLSLHENRSHKEIIQKLFRYYYRINQNLLEQEALEILKDLDAKLPKAIYYGYSYEIAAQKRILTQVLDKIEEMKKAARKELARKRAQTTAASKTTRGRRRS